ncbi:hypothetical protein LAZ67_19002149 [Cordylochernes scorpioides]|uniref:Uncharacterized protein n=1 Tax=Cordylochernes scorpioides TaxID=51811 RepID=A0ABY6LIA4_9ARAC|nr:hypothetical protein LAZ67_19002149 [Cordylochernes scorpioides]
MKAILKTDYQRCFADWKKKWLKSIAANGDYFEGDNFNLDLELEQKAPIYFHQDNQSCLNICSSEKVSSRTKHIATKIHHLKDLQKKTVIKMIYCPTGDMKADILTKPLPRPTFEKLRYNLVMSPHSCRGFVG